MREMSNNITYTQIVSNYLMKLLRILRSKGYFRVVNPFSISTVYFEIKTRVNCMGNVA